MLPNPLSESSVSKSNDDSNVYNNDPQLVAAHSRLVADVHSLERTNYELVSMNNFLKDIIVKLVESGK